jgi:hypothetical protein
MPYFDAQVQAQCEYRYVLSFVYAYTYHQTPLPPCPPPFSRTSSDHQRTARRSFPLNLPYSYACQADQTRIPNPDSEGEGSGFCPPASCPVKRTAHRTPHTAHRTPRQCHERHLSLTLLHGLDLDHPSLRHILETLASG